MVSVLSAGEDLAKGAQQGTQHVQVRGRGRGIGEGLSWQQLQALCHFDPLDSSYGQSRLVR